MNIQTSEIENGVRLVEIEGEIDAYTAGELEQALLGVLAEGSKRLLLDFSQVGYSSSAGLRVLVRIYQQAQQTGAEVRICGPNPRLYNIFEVSGLLKALHISQTRPEALQGW